MRRRHNNNNDTFWISYADLMAGLLFVFVLLVGAIVSKFLFLQEDIKVITKELLQKQHELHISLDELKKKKKKLNMTDSRLNQMEQKAIQSALLISELRKKEAQLQEREKALHVINENLHLELNSSKNALKLTQNELQERALKLQLTRQELETLSKQLLISQEENFKITQNLKDSQADIQDKERALQKSKSTLKTQAQTLFLKNEELTKMANALLEKTKEHQSIVEQLDLTKMQIKHLTGIRIKVISALKDSIGTKVKIDAKNGSIRFNSGVFFKQNGAVLTKQAKKDLSLVLNEYIYTLMSHPDIAPHLDRIDIVGHTNSSGSYLYNLRLSQERAYVVLEYLIAQDFRFADELKKKLSATGRGYNDLIYKDGVEDKDASRRIEIKFRLKDEDAIRQIEKILG